MLWQWLIWVVSMVFGAIVGMRWGYARGFNVGTKHGYRIARGLFR